MIIIYSKADGKIKRKLSIPLSDLEINMNAETEGYIERECAGDATHVVGEELVKKETRTAEECLAKIRMERDSRLFQADIIHCNAERWSAMPPEQQLAWKTYKQALRDLPAVCDPFSPTWPSQPI